jgi:hypothetical protein
MSLVTYQSAAGPDSVGNASAGQRPRQEGRQKEARERSVASAADEGCTEPVLRPVPQTHPHPEPWSLTGSGKSCVPGLTPGHQPLAHGIARGKRGLRAPSQPGRSLSVELLIATRLVHYITIHQTTRQLHIPMVRDNCRKEKDHE